MLQIRIQVLEDEQRENQKVFLYLFYSILIMNFISCMEFCQVYKFV
jgi:hypothetical protein